MSNKTAIVVGAGIVGLATARALSLKGYKVTLVERTQKAVGASIRNFGMLWPVGQPEGTLYNRAVRSREIWKEVADSIGLWYEDAGSLHLAHHADEWVVLQELYDAFKASGRPVELLDKDAIMRRFKGVNGNGLQGGLFSATETIVDPREAIASIPAYLEEYLDVAFVWGKQVNAIAPGKVYIEGRILEADLVFICSGADFETLFPEAFSALPITKCKLQMMRFMPGSPQWRMGTSLCGGLSLIHYNSFKVAPSLGLLRKRYETEMPEYVANGIHVMISQNDKGELTVGDSHEYGHTFDPFDRVHINEMIIHYLKLFAVCDDWKLIQTWNGIYPKMTNGQTDVFLNPMQGVYIMNGLGGAGMTLSFGFAEEMIATL
ncbi:TIGR03364 family FAD-dependent oxidoreductase [Asinibacterium sp. OR53]|uniref:TIGR03364 family FAD-dependent oxidoreductase n=1 Tax=Asinibacterium sp. OR53 TaxID=925409 RepID=UPI00047DB118|nr:TIGR03364 family FAD-dependent oxidoreductase [Asinibacterium sp. OR53]